jgi:hypothetical protein
MRLQLPLASGNGAKQEWRRIAMQIEVHEPASCFYVLQAKILEQRTFAGTRLSEDSHVHRAARLTDAELPLRHLLIGDHKSKRRRAAGFLPRLTPPMQAVPKRTHELFNEANHGCEYARRGVENGNNVPRDEAQKLSNSTGCKRIQRETKCLTGF